MSDYDMEGREMTKAPEGVAAPLEPLTADEFWMIWWDDDFPTTVR